MTAFVHPRYEPGAELGRGSQGLVVRVVDREAPRRPLVAKLWNASGELSPELLQGEFGLLSRLQIPGLVRAHDLARDERTNAPLLIEDFVDGPDAGEWIAAATGRERLDRLVSVIAQVSETLALLHDAGFVHGDLKPAHVRIPPSGRITLLDLGAFVARGGDAAVAYTKGYAAPELLAGARPTPRTDLFGLGALAWAISTGSPPRTGSRELRTEAPWVLPGVADLIAALSATHPEDRPTDARDALRRLAEALPPGALRAVGQARVEATAAGATSRGAELSELSQPNDGVRYVVGPPGSGKSHLLRELSTRALLAGRDARLVRFPCDDPALVVQLVAYFRGADAARPFRAAASGSLLVVLDDLHRAPAELTSALEAFRCRPGASRGLDVMAAVRTAAEGAPRVVLPSLSSPALAELCRELGESDPDRIDELSRASAGSPGWIAAALAGAPLTPEAVIERAERLTPAARGLLAALSVARGPISDAIANELTERAAAALAELSAARLVTRRTTGDTRAWELADSSLAAKLSEVLASYEVVDAFAEVLLDADQPARASLLLSLANAPNPPARRAELLARAAARARAEGLRSEETDALLALAADPARRTAAVLVALDRVTRGGGSAGLHPEIVGWLAERAEQEPELAVLALRRQAERAARSGDASLARELAERALVQAEAAGDPAAVALALSTLGAIALYRADWTAADDALARAHTTIASGAVDDAEEVARLLHNRGVVALYKGRAEEARDAFSRSLEQKRRLGDRAGSWACLLNLGLALAQLSELDEAERALGEALLITRSLSQRSGGGWCLAALADVAVRRGDAREAERRVAEAEHLDTELPAPVRADLAILRAEIALLENDGTRALAALGALEPGVRESDPLIDTRACIVEARARLCRLPAEPRAAARLSIVALRRARGAGLPELEARARAVLSEARGRSPTRAAEAPRARYDEPVLAAEIWRWLETLGTGASGDSAATALARAIVEASGAERAFVALVLPNGELLAAWGVDLEGLEIGDAVRRIDADAVRSALSRSEPVYQRDVESPAGRGSRLVVASPASDGTRAVVIAEHRFATARFDGVQAEVAQRWSVLGAIVGRLTQEPRVSKRDAIEPAIHWTGEASHSRAPTLYEPSTALPLRPRQRQYPTIVGASRELERALGKLDAAVDSELPVLIVGETGVGKELFARALHDHGPRRRAELVAVSCGAIPDSLFEAELFGHVRGSFTGADRARPGLLARAEGGTLFLDEIGELPLARQATLLRALATRSYRPVGSDQEKPFDVRIVAATNRDLGRAVADGTFRQDLLYRLNVLEIHVPPLADREGDVGRIARHVLEREGSAAELSPEALRALEAHHWPGNVRELEHQMQRLAALGVSRIELEHLSREIRTAKPGSRKRHKASRRREPERKKLAPAEERHEVERALEDTGGNITRAADKLGLTRQGLKKRMVRLGLREPVHGARSDAKIREAKG